LTLQISAQALQTRMIARLQGLPQSPPPTGDIIWDNGSQRVKIHAGALQARLIEGWLLCDLSLEAEANGLERIQFLFYLGSPGDDASLQAACTLNAVSARAQQLASIWGNDLHRVLWDAVLDAIEVCLDKAESMNPGQNLTLQGFAATAPPNDPKVAIQVEIAVGAS
jgi:hypothetical protein